jgi:hypothetical protein
MLEHWVLSVLRIGAATALLDLRLPLVIRLSRSGLRCWCCKQWKASGIHP